MPYDPYVLGSNRKIDPTRRPSSLTEFLPDGTPNDGDRVEIGPTDLAFAEWKALGLTIPDMPSLRDYRLSRLVEQVNKHDLGGLLMFDPLNIRYATDTTNMQIWVMHNFCRACLVLPDGHMALWDYTPARHLSAHLPLVKEVHPGADFFYMDAAQRAEERAALFAQQVDSIVRAHAGDNRRLGLDKSEIATYWALENIGFKIRIGQEMTEHARKVKNENELNAMRCAIAACEAAMAEMQAAVIPGMTEVGAWAELQKGNHIRGGEWIETRILSSGPRTNPWFQECGPRIMKEGDILAYDTDMVGPYGYCADMSRTFKIGDGKPSDAEREAYQVAYEQIQNNMQLLKPGASFKELMQGAKPLPEKFRERRYSVMYHGVGLCDEYPAVMYPEDWESTGYDGLLEPGMCVCVEAYVGEVGGTCGVKLEDQVVITETGFENLTKYPFEERLLS